MVHSCNSTIRVLTIFSRGLSCYASRIYRYRIHPSHGRNFRGSVFHRDAARRSSEYRIPSISLCATRILATLVLSRDQLSATAFTIGQSSASIYPLLVDILLVLLRRSRRELWICLSRQICFYPMNKSLIFHCF